MRTNKRIISIVLVLVLTLSLLVGCGGGNDAPDTKPGESTAPAGNSPDANPGPEDIKWPERTIQIIMPYKPGGDSDTYARLAAEKLEGILGVPVVIVNQNGANNTLAPKEVNAADADGYCVLYYNSTMLSQQAVGVFDEFGFSLLDDFTAAGTIGSDNTYAMIASADSGWETWTDVVEVLKGEPESVSFAMIYNGNTHYLELALEDYSGVALKGIDAGSGTADRIVAMLGGQVDLIAGNLSSFTDYIEDGSMVCLGIFTEERNPYYPDIPTLAEQGAPVLCPKNYTFRFKNGTDQAIIDKFSAALEEVCEDPEYQAALAQYCAEAIYMSGEDVAVFDEEYTKSQAETLASLK